MEKQALKELATLSTGVPYKRYQSETGKTYKLVTLRSLNNNTINPEELDEFTTEEEINEKFLAKKNDIIMGLYAPYNTALVNNNYDDIVVSSSFALIRATNINPEYLAYYLNTHEATKNINKLSTGTTIPKISITKIKELKIKKIKQSQEEEYLKLMNILNERINLKNKELKLLKKTREYYLNKLGDNDGDWGIHSKFK